MSKEINEFGEKTAWRQLILLNEEGMILASCDSLFDSQAMREEPIFEMFPLLESIYDDIRALQLHEQPLRISKVETTFPPLKGFYDFTFERTELDSRNPILWIIYDYTRLYKDYFNHQQKKYELELAKELLIKGGYTDN
jgi:hypothetical protein